MVQYTGFPFFHSPNWFPENRFSQDVIVLIPCVGNAGGTSYRGSVGCYQDDIEFSSVRRCISSSPKIPKNSLIGMDSLFVRQHY